VILLDSSRTAKFIRLVGLPKRRPRGCMTTKAVRQTPGDVWYETKRLYFVDPAL
jgi:hypothetical protein